MKLTIPKVIAACGVVGGSGAVIAPVLLSATTQSEVNDSEAKNVIVNKLVSQEGIESFQPNMVNCTNQQLDSWKNADYGTVGNRDVCWAVVQAGSSPEFEEETVYTTLFSKLWSSGNGNWHDSNDVWKSLCMQGQDKWVFENVGEGKEYLGLCRSSVLSPNQAWMSIEGKGREKLNIQVCRGDCWKSERTSDIRKLKEKQGSWAEVQFRTSKL